MPDQFAYDVARALDESKHSLIFSILHFSYDPDLVWKAKDVPLHPGAERYYREKGYLKTNATELRFQGSDRVQKERHNCSQALRDYVCAWVPAVPGTATSYSLWSSFLSRSPAGLKIQLRSRPMNSKAANAVASTKPYFASPK